MSKPRDFSYEDFAEFLRDEIPLEHAEYVMGLLECAKAEYERKQLWAKIQENNND